MCVLVGSRLHSRDHLVLVTKHNLRLRIFLFSGKLNDGESVAKLRLARALTNYSLHSKCSNSLFNRRSTIQKLSTLVVANVADEHLEVALSCI